MTQLLLLRRRFQLQSENHIVACIEGVYFLGGRGQVTALGHQLVVDVQPQVVESELAIVLGQEIDNFGCPELLELNDRTRYGVLG